MAAGVTEGDVALALVHLAATGFMAGLSWTVHVVHYPLFARVGDGDYGGYQRAHMTRISWLLAVPWGTEVVSALALALFAPDGAAQVLAWIGAIAVVLLVAVTALLAAPAHGRLVAGFDPMLHRRLLAVDGVRVALWSLRLGLAVGIVWQVATPA